MSQDIRKDKKKKLKQSQAKSVNVISSIYFVCNERKRQTAGIASGPLSVRASKAAPLYRCILFESKAAKCRRKGELSYSRCVRRISMENGLRPEIGESELAEASHLVFCHCHRNRHR